MAKINVVVSPAFQLAIEDLKSVLRGLLIMTAGTFATLLIDALSKWMGGVDMTGLTLMGVPVLVYIVPLVTALLNTLKKYLEANKYAK